MQKLTTRANFAALAGVNASTVTRLCSTILQAATVGKRIDAAHPAAVEYLEHRDQVQTPEPATGIDPLYEQVVLWCHKNKKFSTSGIQREFKIGYNRAVKIKATMTAAGMDPPGKTVVTIPKPVPRPHVRGTAAAKETKKRESKPGIDDDIFAVPEDIQAFADFTLRELIEKFGTDIRFVDWLNATQKIEAINEKRLKNAVTKGKLISRELVQKAVIDVFNAAHLRLLKDGAKSIAGGVISKHAAGAELNEIERYISELLGSFIKPVKSKIIRSLKEV